MSQMTLFANGASVPAYLREAEDDVTDLLAGKGGQYKRISIKGGVWRMIVNGKEVTKNEDRAMSFIVVATAANNSRTFYDKAFVDGEALRPTCSSVDGTVPDKDVQKAQAASCAACPQNIAGSGANGSRACRYSRRLAVILENDMRTEADVYQLVVPAQSLFGTGDNGKLPLIPYAQYLKANNVRITGVVTEARFDTNSPTPKLTFRAVRPLEEDEYYFAKEKGKTTEALNAINYDPASMDLGSKPTAPAKEEPKQVASRPAFSSKPKEEVDIVQFVAEEEAAVSKEPVKRESKKAVEAVPVELESLLQEWED